MSSDSPQPGYYKIDAVIRSIPDVQKVLKRMNHPLVLVGDAATFFVHSQRVTNNTTIDILISAHKLHVFTKLLARTGNWTRQTTVTEKMAAAAGPGATELKEIQRDADVLFGKTNPSDGPCRFIRVWSETNYRLYINQQSITEVQVVDERVPDDPWRPWNYLPEARPVGRRPTPVNRSAPLLHSSDKVYVPTLPTLLDTLVFQHKKAVKQSMLASDAGNLIERLTRNYELDNPELMRRLLVLVRPLASKFLATYLEEYVRTPTPEPLPHLKVEKAKVKPDATVKHEASGKTGLGSSPDSKDQKRDIKRKRTADEADPDTKGEGDVNDSHPRCTKRARTPASASPPALTYSSPEKRRTQSAPITPSKKPVQEEAPKKPVWKDAFGEPIRREASKSPVQVESTGKTTPRREEAEEETEAKQTVIMWHNGSKKRVPVRKGVALPKAAKKTATKAARNAKTTKNDRVEKRPSPPKQTSRSPSPSSSSPRRLRVRKAEVMKLFIQ